MNKDSKIWVAGNTGLVGSAVVRELRRQGYSNLVFLERSGMWKVDLRNPGDVEWWFSVHRPEYVFMCAARVGGIKDNAGNPLEFFLDNMNIEQNVLLNAAKYGVKKLVFLGSSCIYPRDCPQPIKEEYLLTGPIEKTTEAYALAKIAGIRLCQWLKEQGHNFVSAMPCNLFGINDSVDPRNAHIIPGLLSRMHEAKVRGDKEFKVWGDGTAQREFLFSDDLAKALLLIMDKYNEAEPINTGSGFELTVAGAARVIAGVVGFHGGLVFDAAQPSGTPRKILDNSKITALGWRPETPFIEALRRTYADVKSRRLDIFI